MADRNSLLDLGTHFSINGGRSYFVFTLGTCERCGADVQEANGTQVFLRTSFPEDHGLVKYADGYSEPAEIYPDDETGGYHCENCHS